MVYTYSWVYDVMDGYGDDGMSWADEPCPICDGPLEEVYYGGGVTKWECKGCVKHFITSITSDYDDEQRTEESFRDRRKQSKI